VSLRWRKVFDFVGFKSSFGVKKFPGGLVWLTPSPYQASVHTSVWIKKLHEKIMLDRQLKISKFLVNLFHLAKYILY